MRGDRRAEVNELDEGSGFGKRLYGKNIIEF